MIDYRASIAALKAIIDYLIPQADAGNSHAGAIAAGATSASAWKAWGGNHSMDCVGSCDAAGTLVVEQSRDGANAYAGNTESWAAAAGATWAFPTGKAPGATHYRAYFTDGGAGGAALVYACTASTRAPADARRIAVTSATKTDAGIVGVYAAPVGARRVALHGWITAGGSYSVLQMVMQFNATNGGTAKGPTHGTSSLGYEGPLECRIPSGFPYVCVYSSTSGDCSFQLEWF